MNKLFTLLIIVLFNSGCAAVLQDVKQEDINKMSANQGLVFGKFTQLKKYGQGGKFKILNMSDGKVYEFAVTKRNAKNMKFSRAENNMSLTEDSFSWILPAGRYEFRDLIIGSMNYMAYADDVHLYFDVYSNQKTYIGTINLFVSQTNNYLLFEKYNYLLWVSDEFNEANSILKDEVGDSGDIKRELMVFSQDSKYFEMNKKMAGRVMKDFLENPPRLPGMHDVTRINV